jgi:hypothetical protein
MREEICKVDISKICVGQLRSESTGALLQSVCFAPAVLNARLHHAKEAADPICLFAMSLAELLESVQQFDRSLTAALDFLFDLVEEGVEFAIDFEQ